MVSARPTVLFQLLRSEIASHVGALSAWSSECCSQLRRQARTHRPLFIAHRTSALVLTRGLRAGVEAVDIAARGAQSGLGQVSSQLSGIAAEAGRRAEGAFSTIRVSGEFGLRTIGGRLTRIGPWGLMGRVGLEEQEEGEGEYEGSRLTRLTDTTVQNVVDVVARDGWEHVATTSGVVVYRQYIALGADGTPTPPPPKSAEAVTGPAGVVSGFEAPASTGGRHIIATAAAAAVAPAEASAVGGGSGGGEEAAGKAPQFACVKATAILSVPPEVVYLLFADNSRVSEYNEHCREVRDLEILSQDTKITWAASGRMGPFKVCWRCGGLRGLRGSSRRRGK